MKNQHHRNTILEGQHVTIGYHQKKKQTVVHADLNFSLYSGELTCLLGANGSGKSTLLRTLSAVQPSLQGEISLLGKNVENYTERERSRTIGVVLTERTQTGGLTVGELVALGRQPHTGFFGRLNSTDKELIRHAIASVGITHLATSYMAELSDGERQKAFIAKALVQECPLILLDEPTAFLDVVSRIEIMTLLRKLAREEQKAILLSTHDIDQALLLADHLWLLRVHEGITCGVTEDLILSHQLDTLFPESNLRFDSQHGTYTPRHEYTRSVILQAADERLRHWSENALHRLGYQCLTSSKTSAEDSKTEVSESKSSETPVLHAESPCKLIWETQTKRTECSSFESLIRCMIESTTDSPI